MTQEEYASRRNKIYLVAAIGIAAFIASNAVGYLMPTKGLVAILFTAIFLGCIFIAAMMAFKLNKERAAK
jgi:quinol-cytochrome oxidoreductase complex cytochrome b subunit